MQKRIYNLIACVFFANLIMSAQCPDQPFLYKRLIYLRDASKIPAAEKLIELEGYLSKMNACSYKNDSTHASLLSLIGGLYYQQADFINAVKYRRQAIATIISNAKKPSVKLKQLPGIYYWLSVAYDSLNNFTEKMKALDSCSIIAMRLNYVDRASLTAIYTRLVYFFDIGDYNRCIEYATKCQSLARQYAINNTPTEQKAAESYISSSFGWQVMALLKLEKFSDAEQLLAHKITEYKKAGLTNYLGTTFSQLAEVQLNKGDYKKAISFYNNALEWDRKAGYIFNCKQTQKDIGYVYFSHLNNRDKAMLCYKKALGLVNTDKGLNTEDSFESLDLFARIADVYVQEKKYDSAFYYFRLALNQIRPGGDEKALINNWTGEMIRYKKIYYLTRLLLDKAKAHVSQYKDNKQPAFIKQAIAVFKLTDQLLDQIRTEQRDPQSKLFWRSDSRRLYENAIEACYLYGNKNDAFYFFEKSRAVLLSDQLNEQHWERQQAINQQTQLKKKILWLERKALTINKSSEYYAQLQSELFDGKQNLDRLQQASKINSPAAYQGAVITTEDVQKKILNDHQAFIELFEGDSAVYVLFITARSIQFKKINKQRFDSLSYFFVAYLSDPNRQNKNFIEFTKISQQLYQLIFQNTALPKGRIVISPDATNFPFEALITKDAPRSPTYFITEHAVSYTYSARYLTNYVSNASTKAPMLLGMAPVNYAARLNLPALPGSDRSLLDLENNFKTADYLVAEKASRNNFLQQFYRYRIVQLYTHSTNNGYNGEPTIYFRDSALLLSDLIYENKPATSLIVLSACETGTGKLYQGEGVFSFNRGFAAIGIPSSVSNLWQVDNESTYRLTELFYKGLAKELPVDVALQKAKLEFMNTAGKEKKLPYYWAAPVLAGQSGPVIIEKTFSLGWLEGITGFAFLLFAGWIFFTKKYSRPKNRQVQTERHPVRNTTTA